jgi:hypothetical protein
MASPQERPAHRGGEALGAYVLDRDAEPRPEAAMDAPAHLLGQAERARERPREVPQIDGGCDHHEAHGERAMPVGPERRGAAHRVRDDAVERTEDVGGSLHGVREVKEGRALPRAVAVSGRVERDDAKADGRQRLDEGPELRATSLPAMDEEHARSGGAPLPGGEVAVRGREREAARGWRGRPTRRRGAGVAAG